MRAKVDQFCDWLRNRLAAIENWLESVREDIRLLPWKARKAHLRRLQEAQVRLKDQKERVEQRRTDLQSPSAVATDLVGEFVVEWKPKPVVRDARLGPDAAEVRTAAAIDHAEAGIDEIRDALLAAAATRRPDAGN